MIAAATAGVAIQDKILAGILKIKLLKGKIAVAALISQDANRDPGNMKILDMQLFGTLLDLKPCFARFFKGRAVGDHS